MAWTVILLLLSLVLLAKGGDLFVDGAVALARRLGISEVLIGATIVSIGTTIPEVTVSAIAAAGGHPEVSYGNALGSVICNSALIAGALLLLRPGAVRRRELRLGAGFFFVAGLLFGCMVAVFHGVHRWEGALMALAFLAYIALGVRDARRFPEPVPDEGERGPLWASLLALVAGGSLVYVGSNLLVNNGVEIALRLGVPERVVALTFIALGTSLPELVTAVSAILKRHAGVSLGNIIGANVINLTLVIGVSAMIQPIMITIGAMRLDLLLAALTMGLVALPALKWERTGRWQGAALLMVYAGYCALLFTALR